MKVMRSEGQNKFHFPEMKLVFFNFCFNPAVNLNIVSPPNLPRFGLSLQAPTEAFVCLSPFFLLFFCVLRFFAGALVLLGSCKLSYRLFFSCSRIFLSSNSIFFGKKKNLGKRSFSKKCIFFVPEFFFFLNKMWLLESLSHVLVAGPFKSQAEMAKKTWRVPAIRKSANQAK